MSADEEVASLLREGALREATATALRSGAGVVAWWPEQDRPHPEAMKAEFRWEVAGREVEGGGPCVDSAQGWALAMGSVGDVFALVGLTAWATLVDLGTGRWVHQVQGSLLPTGPKVVRSVPTVDAFGRPRLKLEPRKSIAFETRWNPQPMFDTEVCGPSDWRGALRFFVNPNSFTHGQLATNAKYHGLHASFWSPYIPSGQTYVATGISVSVPSGRGQGFDEFVEGCSVVLRSPTYMVSEVPLADVLVPAPPRSPEPAAYVVRLPPLPIFPFPRPTEFVAHEPMEVEIRLTRQPPRETWFRVSVSGGLSVPTFG